MALQICQDPHSPSPCLVRILFYNPSLILPIPLLETISHTTFLEILQVLDDRGRGDQLLAEMRVKGLAWDSYTYTALMMGRSDRKEVIRLWEDMVAKGKGGESDNDMGGTAVGIGSGILPTQAAAAELFKACELEVITGLLLMPLLCYYAA